MALPDSTYAVVKSRLRFLPRVAKVKNLICQSHTSSSNQFTDEGLGTKKLGGDVSKGGRDERETQGL
jgi:hypothetical protein